MNPDIPQNGRRPAFLAAIKALSVEIAIIIILISLLTLNYFNILPLSSLYPSQLGWLPSRLEGQRLPLPTSSAMDFTTNPLVAEARSLGYTVIWIDTNDTNGRTLFYDNRENTDFNFRGIGPAYISSASNSRQVTSYISGVVQGFEEIEESEDEYILLFNPQDNTPLPKVRLIFSKDAQAQTFLLVENLSFGPLKSYDLERDEQDSNLGALSSLDKESFMRAISKGDAVIVTVVSLTEDDKLENQADENGHLIATALFIRRFLGIQQVDDILKTN